MKSPDKITLATLVVTLLMPAASMAADTKNQGYLIETPAETS